MIPQLRMNQLILRSFTVMGVNALTVLQQYPEMHRAARRAVVQLLADGAITPMVGHIFAFEELAEAFVELAAGRVQGKAAIAVGNGPSADR
jgi:NADPH2:quinone reductase